MRRLALSPAANGDLDDIADYISKDDPERALGYVDQLEARAMTAAERPFTFPSRDDISAGLRAARHKSHLILFRVLDDEVRVVRIVHVARNLDELTIE